MSERMQVMSKMDLGANIDIRPQVYLAGFDVFLKDGLARGEYLKLVCDQNGLKGAYPFDNEIEPGLSKKDAAAWINEMNKEMILNSDALLVNLNLFRGAEPDSGTVFEFAMAYALGKPVWVYFDDGEATSLREIIPHDEQGFDEKGFMVEDFEHPRNLMLACNWTGKSRTAEEAAKDLAQYLKDEEMRQVANLLEIRTLRGGL